MSEIESAYMKKNLFNLFFSNVKTFPEKTSYMFEDTTLTYRQTAALAFQLSQYMREIGVKEGTHIGVIANNSLEFALLFWGTAYLGAVLVPFMPSYQPETIKSLSQATDIEIIFIEKNLLPAKKQALENFKIFSIPDVETLRQQTQDSIVKESQADPDAPFIITLTSGSTSQPKPIVFSQAAKIKRSIHGAKELYELSDKDVTIVSTPMYHSMGMRMSLLPLLMGATGVILPRFSPSLWIEQVEKAGVTFAIVVSNQIEAILDFLEKENVKIKSSKKLVSSSYTLKLETKQRFLDRVKCQFYECYGASEIGIATSMEFQEGGAKLESVGKPLPYVDIKILDENDRPLPSRGEGEIAVKTITLFSGYYQNEEATKKSFWEEYFKTGDVGCIDEDGFLYYRGREKDIIKYGAVNLYPGDIENVLMRFKGVKECAVVGMEDKYLGEVPLAAIVSDEKIEKKDLRKFCLDHLADYQVPVDFVFIDAIPKNELGKVQKFKLKDGLLGDYKMKKMQFV